MQNPNPAPAYQLIHKGKDITQNFVGRLISLELTENRNQDADELNLTLDDSDGLLALPRHQDKISVAIGWAGEPLVHKGVFLVDETAHSGTPDQLQLRARSQDVSSGLLSKREKSYHDTTLDAVVAFIAKANELEYRIDAALGAEQVKHLDQTGESDMNFLTRIAKDHDALLTIKNDLLLMMPIASGKSVNGTPLEQLTLTRVDGDQHHFTQADRQGKAWTGTQAVYQDMEGAERKTVTAGEDGNRYELRSQFADKASAQKAANSEWQRLQRAGATLSYTLAWGRPNIHPEMTATLSGIKSSLDAVIWVLNKVTHSIQGGGYTTALEMEVKEGSK